MALVETIDRGNEIEFTVTFLNKDEESLLPATAQVTVNYLNRQGARESQIVELTHQTGDVWYGVWDSQVALPARTYWNVRSFSPDSSEDGVFELAGNLANLNDETTS